MVGISPIAQQYWKLVKAHPKLFRYHERKELIKMMRQLYEASSETSDTKRFRLVHKLSVLDIVVNEVGLGKTAALAILMVDQIEAGLVDTTELEKTFQTPVKTVVSGLSKVKELYDKNTSVESENFRKLFLSFAEDVRVILIIIADQLHTMRTLAQYPDDFRIHTARQCSYLFAPLAHRMGLYKIKTELEDLSLKYTNREIYTDIAQKLNETKRSRDQYIKSFIEPLEAKLTGLGLPFSIKGRTKSIHSIYNKIKKQNTNFENIYDLFAIRIIFDVPVEKEKAACWQAYSVIADMYQPNPKRLRDWLTIPKSNGYESLHTTVLGPQGKWVEVQIRT
ncbi:MAG: bifunctional (p)ppGpp synthetase/guanosine-3',5'-bis(diphosphate) 3'-pyrophosphohydrolase, partial [Paludibacter sp.]